MIVPKGTSWASHIRNSVPGTSKYEVYKTRMETNGEAWYSTIEAAKDAVLSDPNTYMYGYSTVAHDTLGLMALSMDDFTPVPGGIGFQKNSELVDIFNYQMLKLAECGITKRIDKNWPDISRHEEFGMAEPGALGFNNVLFPFSLLGMGVSIAFIIAMLEYVIRSHIRK